jgi:thiamine transporter ThiT
MKKFSTKNLVLSGLFLALCMLLPFITGQIPAIGKALLPMHIPVLLCGFICGAPYGVIVGFIAPLLRNLLFQFPPMPTAATMAFELAAYGLLAGLLYKALPKKPLFVYVSLLLSMIGGRLVWGLASLIIYGLSGASFTWELFMGGALLNAIPGIIAQIVLIPVIIMALRKGRLLQDV